METQLLRGPRPPGTREVVEALKPKPTPAPLPTCYQGRPKDINDLSLEERRRYRLAHPDSITEVTTQEGLQEAVEYCRAKGLTSFDLETTGLNPWQGEIILVQLGDEERQFLIWYAAVDPAPITALLADKSVCKAGVNLLFDLKWWLVKHGLKARAWNVADAQLVEQILGCGLFLENPKVVLALTSMGAMSKRWFGLELDKDFEIRTGWGELPTGQWTPSRREFLRRLRAQNHTITPEEEAVLWQTEVRKGERRRLYAADDVVMPIKLLRKQKPWIQHLGLVQTINLEHQALPVTAEMSVRGLKLDVAAWTKLADEAAAEKLAAEKELDQLFGVEYEIHQARDGTVQVERSVDYTSGDQLRDLIYQYMLTHYDVHVVSNNRQFKELLLKNPKVNPERVEKLFVPRMVPNPRKPGKKQKEGYPDMSDVVEKHWDLYSRYLPPNHFRLPDTDSDTLRLFRIIHETPDVEVDPELPTHIGLPPALVDPLLRLRGASKNVSTYGYGWLERIEPSTGRLHAEILQGALTTGRYSSSPNFMNFPADQRYRACFIAEPGYRIVGSDFSQIEPRIIAQLSGDPTYMRVFWSERPETEGFRRWCLELTEGGKLDLYTEIGKLAGVIPPHYTAKDCKGDDATPEGLLGRQQAKILVLMLGYGGGKDKFWISLMLDTGRHWRKQDADAIYDRFFAMVDRLKATLDKASQLCQPKDLTFRGGGKRLRSPRRVWHPLVGAEVTWSESLGGRKRFYDEDNPSWWTQGRNHPAQACLVGTTRVFERTRGYVPIESLVGAGPLEVWDGTSFVRAERVAPSGEKRLLRVTLMGGYKIECSPDHRFLVRSVRGAERWVRAEHLAQLGPNFRVVMADAVRDWSVDCPLPELAPSLAHNHVPACLSQIEDEAQLGEVLGRIASDGAYSVARGTVTLLVAEHEEAIMPRLRSALAQLGNVRQRSTVKEGYAPVYGLHVHRASLAKQLHAMGIKTHIPAFVWSSATLLSSYLRGMFDGDGTVTRDGSPLLTFGRADSRLGWALEIQQALLLLGIRSRVRVTTRTSKTDNGRTVVQVEKRDALKFAERVGFLNPEKQTRLRERASALSTWSDGRTFTRVRQDSKAYGFALRVQSVEDTGLYVPMYDVVNSDTSRFMANGMVTHNSGADILKRAQVEVTHWAWENDIDGGIINLAHDEYLIEALEAHAEAFREKLDEVMCSVGEKYCPDVPISASAYVGDFWCKD